jgi:hypothetical protein
MSRNKRLPTLLGGLGAIAVLGAGASFAAGGQPDRTLEARSALHGGKAKNVSSSSETAWATPRSRPPATTSSAPPVG